MNKRYIGFLLTALLFCCVIAPAAEGQVVGRFGNGALTKFKRDSTFRIDLDTAHSPIKAWIKTVGDSLGYAAKDTVTLIARTSFSASDTSTVLFFNDVYDRSTGAYSRLAAAHAMGDWRVRTVAITHEFDSSGTYNKRDTIAAAENDVIIPRGAAIYITYTAAQTSSNGTEPRSLHYDQEINIYYRARQGSTLVRCSSPVKVPIILGFGSGWTHGIGVMADHYIIVTVRLAGK